MKKLGIFLLSIFIFFILSCEIGLGASVDTEAPILEITNPPSDAVIRDDFAIQGIWTDDGTLSSVSVEMVRLENNQKTSFTGTITSTSEKNTSGNWSIVITPKETGLIDGTYEAVVSINDNGGHTTIMARTFTIDNTPPVLLLSRPSTKADSLTPDSYGQTFTLEGKAADDNDVSLIEVNVFKTSTSTEPLKTVELTSIPLTIEQDVAIFKAGEANAYSTIYGHTDENGVIKQDEIGAPEERYCTITIYDNAQRFPSDGSTQSAEDRKGNSTNSYYMNSEITSILPGYKITDLYHILNGNYHASADRTVATDAVKQVLNEKVVTKSKFSLNPANNPHFIVTSRSAFNEGEAITEQLTAGNNHLEIEVAPGLDKFPIDPDSVGVYLVKCNDKGIIDLDSDGKPKQTICLFEPGAENHTADKVTIVQSGSTYKFKTANSIDKNYYPGLAVETYYRIQVTGHDSQGVEKGKIVTEGNGIYAFKLVSSGDKIELSGKSQPDYISKLQEAYSVPGHDKLTVTLNWKSGEGPFDIYREYEDGSDRTKISSVTTPLNSNGEWQYEDEIECSNLKDKGFPKIIKYHLRSASSGDSAGEDPISTEASIQLKYDAEKPHISNINLTNSYLKEEPKLDVQGNVEKDAEGNVIKKITYFVKNDNGKKSDLSGIATDETGIEKVELIIPGLETKVLNTARFNFTGEKAIDFSSLSDSVTAQILVTDVAGNQETEDLDILFDTTAPAGKHEIDALGKDLYFRVGEGNGGAGSKYSKDSYGNSSTIKIHGYFDDSKYVEITTGENGNKNYQIKDAVNSSGLAMIYYKVFESEPDETDLSNFETNYDSNTSPDKADGYFKPLETSKTYTVSKNVINETTGALEAETKEVKTTYEATIAGFDKTVNYLALVAVDNVGNAALERVKVSTGSGPNDFEIYGMYVMNNDTENPTITSGKKFEDTQYVNSTATEKLVIYGIAEDASAGIDSITVKVNNKEIPAPGSTPEVNGTIKFYKGDVSNEKNDQNQVTKTIITYTEEDTEKTEEISTEYKDITSFTDNKLYWKLEIKPSVFDGVTSGNVSVYATVKDKAGTGNSQTVTIATVNVDKIAPTAEIKTPCKAEDTGVYINKKIEISGNASDKNQIKEVLGLYYKSGSVTTPLTDLTDWTKINAVADGTNNWSFTNVDTESLPSEELSMTVAVKDMAGNIGYAAPIKVTVDQDSDRPILTLSQIEEKTAEKTSTIKTKNVYGSIKDDDGTVKKFWYWSKQTKNGEAPTAAPSDTEDNGWTPVEVNGNSWSIDSTESDGETTWYFAIEDGEGCIFWTCAKDENDADAPLSQPYILYKGESTKKNNTTGVTFKYDTNPPVATHLYLYRAETSDTCTLVDVKADSTIEWSEENEIAFGGNYQKLFVKITVNESTEMKKLAGSSGHAPTSSPVTISYKNAAGKSFNYEEIDEVHEDGSNEYTYYLGPLVMDTTEKHNFNVTVEDASENKGYISRDIIVDNTAPAEITGVKPKKGSPESGIVNFRGGVNDNKNGSGLLYKLDDSGNLSEYGLQYYIPKYSEKDIEPKNIDSSKWLTPTTPGASSWEIEFTNLGTVIGYNGSTYEVSPDFNGYETSDGSGLYDIPVWFRLTDMVGNVGYNTANAITYNPNADRPTIDFTYPVHDKTLENGTSYVIMGGTITISGMATDDDGITAVYLQFDTDGDGTYDNSGFTTELIPDINQTIEAVKATGTKSWYYTMSLSRFEHLNAQKDGRTLNVRAIAIEKDDEKLDAGENLLYSAWTKNPLHISVNNDVPNFSSFKLKRFETAPTAETLSTAVALAEQDYTNGMYINGGEDWYLVGDAEVTSGSLARITLTGKDINGLSYTADTNDTDTLIAKKKDVEHGDAITFAIPIQLKNGATTGFWSTELYVEDDTAGSPRNNKNQLVINLDSDAPDFADKNADGTRIKLYKNAYGSAGTEINKTDSDKFVQNSNGAVFTFAGKITEGGSGFERLVFYYKRKNSSGGDVRIYNPMEAHGADNTANRVDIGDAVSFNSEELPVLSLTGVTRDNKVTVKDDAISGNANIRKGGLVKIGGVYRIIEDVSSDTVTFSPSCSTSYTDVEFVYGMVVDHNGESEKSDGSIKNDDGDGMLESFTKAGSSYTWDATIKSKNIPDGPIEIHCVVFDAAGNSRHGYTETKVSNNPPRLTSLKLGTDLNSDNKYALDSEFQTYYANLKDDGSGNTKTGVDVWNLNTSTYSGEAGDYWIAKKDLVLITEFVGGSGTIYYRYDKTAGESAADITSANTGSISGATPTLAALLNSHEKIVSTLNPTEVAKLSVSQTDNRIGAIILKNDAEDGLGKLGWTDGEDSVNLYTFSFWDSTEECTVGSDTQWAVLNLRFKQDLIDNTAPTGSITPFYWNSKNNNSLVYDDKGNALGHIELPSDLPGSFTTSGSGVMDRDPKVSGKIKIEGEASDETLLQSIKLTFDDNKSVTATYNAAAKSWTYSEKPEGFNLEITDEHGPLQTGHSVIWTYTVDTSKIDDVAKANVSISLEIKDASTATAGGNGSSVDPYQVDVVPYITGITTAFSAKLKSSIREAYSRTALGHYIARADETITIKGFNISSTGEVPLSVSSLTQSGPYSLTVNGIETLNNLNNNNACGSYEGSITESSLYSDKATYAYNRLPNRTSNSLLTDDVVIDIWQFDSDAALPMSGELREPSMQINPVTGQVGLAFVSGPAHFAMAGKVTETAYSYAEWQRNYATYNNISFAYDGLGHAHATATGLDTNPSSHHAGRFSYFYDNWYTGNSLNTQTGNYDGKNALRLESIAVPYIEPEVISEDKETYNSYLENLNNGDLPLEIRKNYKILANEELIKTDAGSMTETRFSSPSLVTTVHGSGSSAKTAAYLAYYDSVQKQIRFRFNSEVASDKKTSKDDFIDEKGYKHGKTGDEDGTGSMYFEANTKYFSLIAGLDTQQGETRSKEYTGDVAVNKTDAEGNALHKRATYRRSEFDSNGALVKNKNENNYDLTTFKVNDAFLNALKTENLKSRFTKGQTVDVIRNDNKYIWIIQPDGLIYYTTDSNDAKGYMTHKISEYKASDKSLNGCKLDPAENYIVYERVSETAGNYYLENGQPPYFWPYATAANAIKVEVPVHQINYYKAYDTGYTAYKYVAIDAMAGSDAAHDKVVAVWYDGTNCHYAYNDNPTSGKDNGDEVTIDGVTYGGGWKNNQIIFSEGGEHCTVKLDSGGGVHIAAYVDGSLRYAHLDSPAAEYNEATDSVKVDSFTITGERITLDVGKDSNGKVIPYISYFNGTARLPCVAKLVVPAGTEPDYKAQGTGTDDGEDMFTGNWEISLVPSPKTLTTNYYDKMNICLWKKNGSIVRGDDDGFTISKDKTTNDNSSGTTNGNIYGNGTANPILGYAIESTSGTCLETAQMK